MPDTTIAQGQLRVSDAERERVTDQLAEHHAAGRLTLAELDERLSAALSARTRDELAAPLADLPTQPDRPASATSRRPSVAAIGWRTHLGSYLAMIAGLWLIWALTGGGYPWPIWPMLGWGIGLLGHRAGMTLCRRGTTPLEPLYKPGSGRVRASESG
jgi:hypothetical protein